MFVNKLTLANMYAIINIHKANKGDIHMTEELETRNCIVAFLDLLGTSATIMNDEHDS